MPEATLRHHVGRSDLPADTARQAPSRRDLLRAAGAGLLGAAGIASPAVMAGLGTGGCSRPDKPDKGTVTLYVSLDREFSTPVVKLFEEETGIPVEIVSDSERTKSVGLMGRLLAEKERPGADVFWNNEPGNTAWAARQGVFEPHISPAADDIPARWRHPTGLWTGFAARGRVIVVNRARLAGNDPPRNLWQFGAYADRPRGAVIARPVAGTTMTHVAAVFRMAGAAVAKSKLAELKSRGVNFQAAGNADVVRLVAAGEFAVGLTDTDDVLTARAAGKPVELVWPSGEADFERTLVLPNTVSLVKGGPNPRGGRALVDFLLSRRVEQILAAGPSGQIPLRPGAAMPKSLPGMPPAAEWAVPEWDTLCDVRLDADKFVNESLVA